MRAWLSGYVQRMALKYIITNICLQQGDGINFEWVFKG